jgi:transposase
LRALHYGRNAVSVYGWMVDGIVYLSGFPGFGERIGCFRELGWSWSGSWWKSDSELAGSPFGGLAGELVMRITEDSLD